MKKIIQSFILALAATFSFAAIRLPVSKAFWSSSCQCSELCRNLVYIEKEEVTSTSSFSLPYLMALTSSMISSSLMSGVAEHLLMKRSSSCSRVLCC